MMGPQWHQLDNMQSFAPCSRQTTTPAPRHSFFALSNAKPTVSRHWRQVSAVITIYTLIAPVP